MDSIQIPAPKFSIGDEVFHITPESPKGVVLDARYCLLARQWEYLVTYGYKDECICKQMELSKSKAF